MDHLPAGMELFPAADEDQWELIKQVIDQSDYYVVVVAGRYGSLGADGISYTEKEYDYAVESGIPVLGFVHQDPGSIPGGKLELDAEAQKLLTAFRDKVKSKPVNFFTSAEGLSGLVVTSLIRAIRNHPRVGWVRGDKAMTVEQEREMLDLRKELEKARQARVEAERALVEDTSELAQGGDISPISYNLEFNSEGKRYRVRVRPSIPWDAIFANIGTMLIDEASVKQLRARCDGLFLKYIDTIELDIPEDVSNFHSTLLNESWDTIELQLRALGLIDTGAKKRAVQDGGKYLRLTEKGVRHLAVLRAIRRDSTSSTE